MRQRYMFSDILFALGGVRDMRDTPRSPRADWVYFAGQNHFRSNAQFFQDLWVLHQLDEKRGGFFVEFGAADGVKDSNTLLLERDYGWSGIVAEPAQVWRRALAENRSCSVDHRCVWSRTGESLNFVEAGAAVESGLASFVTPDANENARRYAVDTVSLNDLLVHWKAPRQIDYLSLDTEGSELEILQAFDFSAWNIGLISVEHNDTDRRAPLFDLITSKGYDRVLEGLSGVDDWYVKS